MFTTTIGRTFLTEYNRRENKNLTAEEFYDEVFFPLFFDHPKYLMWAQNSPFVQGISKKKPFFEHNERVEKLAQFHEKVARGERDASIAIGYPASEVKEFATTSGLVTDLEVPMDEEEVYHSWIGGALTIGVAGGYAILFNDPEITYATFEGWKLYRSFLNDDSLSLLRPNQVTTWNGQWLTYRFGKRYREDVDFRTLESQGAFSIDKDKIEVNTVEWSKLFFSLSYQFPERVQTGYVFSLGQTNKTLGFFPFYFKSGRTLVEIYQKLFSKESYEVNKNDFEALFGKHIKRACELGAIGLQALEPKNLSKYFADASNLNLKAPDLSMKKNESEEDYAERKTKLEGKDKENIITFQTYKTWLIAMITKNKEEMLDYTSGIAKALLKYREGARKNDRKNLLEKQLFASSKKRDFLKALNEIVSDSSVETEIIEQIKELRDRAFLMSEEDFTYLALLLKFDYAYQERIANN